MTGESRRVTIKDVALAAGVGVGTVSRALNNIGGVSANSREHIQQVAVELGYRPNPHARFLKTGASRNIAVMMKGRDNALFHSMIGPMEARFREQGFRFSLVSVAYTGDEVLQARHTVEDDKVSGVVFLGGNITHSPQDLASLTVPWVLSTVSELPNVDPSLYSSVGLDDEREACRIVNHLVGLGHRRIALLGVPETDTSVGALRRKGYRNALLAAGIRPDPELECQLDTPGFTPYTFNYGYRLMKRLLRARPDVTAVFAVADVIAIGACRAILESGLTIPRDVSVAGFDGTEMARYYHPSLTTITQPALAMAEATCQILFDLMASGRSQHLVYAGELTLAESSGPPRMPRAGAGA